MFLQNAHPVQGVVGNGQTSMGDWLKLETAIQSLLDTDEDWDGE